MNTDSGSPQTLSYRRSSAFIGGSKDYEPMMVTFSDQPDDPIAALAAPETLATRESLRIMRLRPARIA
jgi:hypothetical protein